MKRILDFAFSLFLIVILCPVLIAIALLIHFTSSGPVLFKQRRIGKHNEEFNILKFRTMYINSPKDTPTHLFENPEKYITSVGKFLRKTSLDELPQILNIIRGDMSFVGPRPALYNQYDLIELRDKYGVNNIRPGLTGWAQVNGRDELPISAKVEYDRYYMENRSICFDLKILFMTALSVILRKGIVEGKQKSQDSNLSI